MFAGVIRTDVWDKCTSFLFLFQFYYREITRLMYYLPLLPITLIKVSQEAKLLYPRLPAEKVSIAAI